MKRVAVYAGTFDPPTLGHLDIVKRAAPLFDTLYVLVAHNTSKNHVFDVSERVELLRKSCDEAGLSKDVRVDSHQGLVVDFCNKVKAKILIRGIRAVSDFEKEFQIATLNRHLDSKIESLHIMTDEKYFYLSSSLVKEVAIMGTDLSRFVPKVVAKAMAAKLRQKNSPQSSKAKKRNSK